MKTIYYAHSLRIYNTSKEQLELKQISSLFPSWNIINPNGVINDIKSAFSLIDKSDCVVASELKQHLGKGVHDEICYALSQKKLVHVLRNGRLFRVYSKHQLEMVDIDWQIHYARVYSGFLILPLQERLKVERIKAKALHPSVGILDDVASTTKEFLIAVGRIQLLSELLGERVK